MNKKIFKSIWNPFLHSWVAVSEIVKGRSKAATIAVLSGCVMSPLAQGATWIGGADDWFTPGNWDTSSVPGSSDAVLISNGGNANVNAGQSAVSAGLTITSGTLTVNQGGTLNSGPLSIGSNAGIATVHINGGTISAYSRSYVGNGSQEAAVIVENNGTLNIGEYLSIGNTGVGKLILNSGTVKVSTGYAVRIAEETGSTGHVIVNGGRLVGGTDGDNLLVGRKGNGILEVNNGGRVEATWVVVGGEYRGGNLTAQGGAGHVILNDDAVLEMTRISAQGAGIVIAAKNSSGTVTLNDRSIMRTVGDASIYVGYAGLGELILNNGLVQSNGLLSIGTLNTVTDGTGNGSVIVEGGGINVGTNLYVGQSGQGTLTINGGEVNVVNISRIGLNAGSTGTMTINAGKMVTSAALYVGSSGTGTFNMNGGLFTHNNGVWVAPFAGAVGTVNLNGGVLETNQVSGYLGDGTASLNFDGGSLKALSDNSGFVQGLKNFRISTNGAKIDSNGFDIGINSAMTGASDSSFTKLGAGTLSMHVANPAYFGGVVVDSGTLELPVDQSLHNANAVTLNNNSVLNTLTTAQTLNRLSGDAGSVVNADNTGLTAVTLNNGIGQDSTYWGVINSTGTVEKTGAGALTLGNNSWVEDFNHLAGRLNIAGGSTLTVASATTVDGSGTVLGLVAGTPAIVAGSAVLSNTPTIDINGYDPRTNTNFYTLIQTTGGISGNHHVTVGGIPINTFVDLNTYLIGSSFIDSTGKDLVADVTLVWNNPVVSGAHGTFNITDNNTFDVGAALENKTGPALAFGWDGTTLDKLGTGTLYLNGVNTYTGLTDIQEGKLIVGSTVASNTATLTGDVNVQAGAVLGGHGQILGQVHLFDGSTISPGNSIGTLTVGDITFDRNSTYEFEVNQDGTADKINSTGTATINGGTVGVKANGNIWNTTDIYTILTANTGVTGTYTGLTSNLTFLDGQLSYDANNVYLKFVRNSTCLACIGRSFNEVNTGHGIESLGTGTLYNTIISMDRFSALSAYNNLSGEIHASSVSALLSNSRYVRAGVNQHLMSRSPEPADNLWAYTWGHDGHIKNDGNAERLNNKGYGVLLGVDRPITEHTQIGIATGYEQTTVKVQGMRQSQADIDAYHFMLYGKTKAGNIDFRGGLGYAHLKLDTRRNIWVNGVQGQNTANYNGHQLQAFVEGSQTFTMSEQTSVTPYLNLAYVQVKANGFNERGNVTALTGHSQTNNLGIVTIGTRGQMTLGQHQQHSLYADVGILNRFGDKTPEAQLSFIGGLPYTLRGTDQGHTSALIGLGANLEIKPNMNLTLGYEGEMGSHGEDHSVKAQLQWRF